jgi:hypothetical protein
VEAGETKTTFGRSSAVEAFSDRFRDLHTLSGPTRRCSRPLKTASAERQTVRPLVSSFHPFSLRGRKSFLPFQKRSPILRIEYV